MILTTRQQQFSQTARSVVLCVHGWKVLVDKPGMLVEPANSAGNQPAIGIAESIGGYDRPRHPPR